MNPPLTILIPAKREEEAIIPTLASLEQLVKTPHDTIVVNDSDISDKTAVVVKKYAREHDGVRLIRKVRRMPNGGTFGSALALGFAAVKSGYVVPVMADLSDDPTSIDNMYKKACNGSWDIVAASRYAKGGKKIGGPALQSFFSKLVCWSLRLFTGIPTTDVSNAFKMYKVSMLKKLPFPEGSGVEASMELTLMAYFTGARITDVPTVWTGRTIGLSKFQLYERAPKYMRIYLWAIISSIRKRLHLPTRPLPSLL